MEASQSSPECVIRAAEADDLSAIFDIYDDAVLNSIATFDTEPKSPEERRGWFREFAHPYGLFVAERAGEVLGWAGLRPFRPKPAYRYTAENSVYVRSDVAGNGIGKLLLQRTLEAAIENGFHAVVAGIALPNEASERLHASLGFERVGVEREVGYKFERWIDVLWMQRLLTE
jgi:L-amino acid N-acyltransferase YncA